MSAALPRVIFFSRLPEPGKVKTRLIPALGAQGAARLQRRLGLRLLARLRGLARETPLELELCFTGGSEDQARAWLGKGILYRQQGPGDLGRRMERALHRALAEGAPRAVLVGSDLPGLQGAHVAQALEELRRRALVLGPSTDGGYYLVGLARPAPGLLAPPHWESLAALSARAAEWGLEPALLPTLRDLDTPGDLVFWRDNDPKLLA
jgi:rSAM/selenodomain-associated transferase 1